MHGENVETVRRWLAAFNARDLDGMAAETTPDVELHSLRAQLEGKFYRGRDGMAEMLADFDEDWESLRVEADDIRDSSGEVVMLARIRARGRTSGVDLDVPVGFVWRLRDGKLAHGKTFSDPADALRAVGLG